MPQPRSRVAFGSFEFDPATGELWQQDVRVALQPQPARLLELLVTRSGEVVTREEIRQALWGDDTHVDFARSLNFCVARLRAALCDNAAEPRLIETVPTRGYRFLATPHRVVTTPRGVREGSTPRGVREGSDPPQTPPGADAATPAIVVRGRNRHVLYAAVLLAVVGVLALTFLQARVGPPKVVVVPFHNETGLPDLDRIAKGVSDATVVKLSEIDRLKVIGNASGLTFSFRPPDMKAMGESLGAQYLVLGQMKRDERRMRIVAHLIRVSDQTHVWAHTYDADALDLDAQSTIADQIARAVAGRIARS